MAGEAGEDQDPARASEAPFFTEEEKLLDLAVPAAEIRRKAAALNVTSPQAQVRVGDTTHVISRTDPADGGSGGAPGTVLAEHDDGWTIQTADHPLRFTRG
ncbi:hypothetical protein [Kribbella pittospori]|uniref:hypothetical protein n=1 Tax=Kribbella pittospori TaxID=722689 RepID=UPI0013F40268|nr:hypothetical protein [Kribbella pittospori]